MPSNPQACKYNSIVYKGLKRIRSIKKTLHFDHFIGFLSFLIFRESMFGPILLFSIYIKIHSNMIGDIKNKKKESSSNISHESRTVPISLIK